MYRQKWVVLADYNTLKNVEKLHKVYIYLRKEIL